MIIVATFAKWLEAQEGRDDPVGELSRWWKSMEGNRPRINSPSGFQNYIKTAFPGGSEGLSGAQDRYNAALAEFTADRRAPAVTEAGMGAVQAQLDEIKAMLGQIIILVENGTLIAAEAETEAIVYDWPLLSQAADFTEEAAG